jgi:hypothetical protein
MCHWMKAVSSLYQPIALDQNWAWASRVLVGRVVVCLAWSCYWTGVSLYCLIMLVTRLQDPLIWKPPSLLKFHGWTLIMIATFIKWSNISFCFIYYGGAAKVDAVLGCHRLLYLAHACMCHALLTSGLDGSTYLSKIRLATPAWAAIYTWDFHA